MIEHNPQKPAEWYDEHYDSALLPYRHYTASKYYFLWALVASKILAFDPQPMRVLDLGCGTGQFAALLWDHGISDYIGIDFSATAIKLARAAGPKRYRFIKGDLLTAELPPDYDCVTLIETLEHIERDMDVLARIRPGVPVIITVPDFPSESHVRYFENKNDVLLHYIDLFKTETIFLSRWKCGRNASFFIFEGVKI